MPIARELTLPKHRQLFYGGQWHEPTSGTYTETLNPASQESLGSIAVANERDADLAVQSAHIAFQEFKRTAPLSRAKMLKDAAAVVRQHAEDLAMIDSLDCGNPVSEMLADADFAATQLEYFAGLVHEAKGQTIPMNGNSINFTVREPLGPCVRIYAFNHPFMFAAAKLAAPIAVGNTVILKPPEQASLSSLRLMELLESVFPPGVVNCVTGGKQAGATLASHPLVAKVALIGSGAAGKAVMRGASATLKQVLLELGGKNALIIYPNADLDRATTGGVQGMNFLWCGQSCGSTSRLFAHDSIYDRVVEDIVRKTRLAHVPGIPTDRSTTMGCMINEEAYQRVLSYVNAGIREGARLVLGGKRSGDPKLTKGYFIEPTIFSDVTPDMTIAQEEIFGPVLSILKWSDEEELFAAVNGVHLGLTCSIWTLDVTTALQAAARVEAGYVWINSAGEHFVGAPFGGYKQSGLGREQCLEEMLDFTQVKNINIARQ
jgi:betaine-aldehyde dehydrogenase